MKHLKRFNEGNIFTNLMKPYIHPDFHEDLYGREGKHEVKIIGKREKKSLIGGDKYFLSIKFEDGFRQEVEVDYPTYCDNEAGETTWFNL